MARDLAFQASALKEAAEYQVTATFYIDQAAPSFDRNPTRAADYYLAAICVLEHAYSLLDGYPLGAIAMSEIRARIDSFRSFEQDLRTKQPYIERGGRRG